MASSSSQNHARLIREIARETTKSSRSSQRSQGSSSPQPTISDFDPENEAIMSTQQLDNNLQKLPTLRASAQKYNRFHRPSRPDPQIKPELDYAINTSAIGRAFPDFSQGGTSSDEGSMSIEIGRGAKKATSGSISKAAWSGEYQPNVRLDLEEDSLDAAVPMIGDYVVTGTPPLQQRQPSTKATEHDRRSARHDQQTRKSSGLRKEIVETSPALAKTTDYGSGESGRGSGEQGRTLAAMHARVRDETDLSQLNENRPPTVDLTTRSTRFGLPKSQQILLTSKGLPTKFSSARGLTTASGLGRKAKFHGASTPNQGTQQSFLLPDMPNMSELVSGIFEDGTPVFSRRAKPRPSRFAGKPAFTDVGEMPLPEDEQAIFLSLKLLQDKIAILEKNQAENEGIINDLEHKNRDLEVEAIQQKKRASHRSDSALGSSESDDEGRKLMIEKNRLASSVHALQAQLDAFGRKITTAEAIIRTITQERDSAVSQLSVAYVTIKQLEAENEDLRKENQLLRDPTHGSSQDHKTQTKNLTGTNHQTAMKASDSQKSPIKATRLSKPANLYTTTGTATEDDDADMFDLTPKPQSAANIPRKVAEQDHDEISDGSEASIQPVRQNRNKGKQRAKTNSSHRGHNINEDPSQDITYLSFLDGDEVAKLRRTLEEERIQRKQKQSMKSQSLGEAAFVREQPQSNEHAQESAPLPRRSSMKDLTAKSRKPTYQENAAGNEKDLLEHGRRHSETSIVSERSRRPQLDAENITSAFIIPDITIRATALTASEAPEPSNEHKVILENLAHHSQENCMVCKRNPNHAGQHDQNIIISKPVAVSDRKAPQSAFEEEPTIRPSQPPGLALATVIKGLEDEIAHLKIELTKYQALYNGHDPALGKRKRKSVLEKMQDLSQAIDVKSDQIYALYDVLEGQKRAGHELNDHEVEITLQSVGIDAASLHLRGGEVTEDEGRKTGTTDRHPWDLNSEDEEEDELPWEGIESTVETNKSGFPRSNRRGSAIA